MLPSILVPNPLTGNVVHARPPRYRCSFQRKELVMAVAMIGVELYPVRRLVLVLGRSAANTARVRLLASARVPPAVVPEGITNPPSRHLRRPMSHTAMNEAIAASASKIAAMAPWNSQYRLAG